MGDISRKGASSTVQIVGESEANIAKVNALQELQTAEVSNASAVDTTLTVQSSVELKVGATRLPHRKSILIVPLNGKIEVGFTQGTESLLVQKNQQVILPIGDSIPIYAKGTSLVNVYVAELS